MPAKEPALDRLTSQLYHLPAIIGRLGLSIANTQKVLNADYVENVKKLMGLIARTLGDSTDEEVQQKAAAMHSLLESLAPSRYQFTETTIDFSADLAETADLTVAGGIGFGAQAVTVNAAFSLGYGYDYRAAARIRVNLHAYPSDPHMAKALLERAASLQADKLDLPQLSAIEKESWDTVTDIYNALTARQVAAVDAADPAADGANPAPGGVNPVPGGANP
jgi:hypothetical protein